MRLDPHPGELLVPLEPGVSLAAARSEAADPDRVVLTINGAGANLRMWSPILADLERGCGVIRFDLRGTGRSRGGTAPFSLERHADDAGRLLEALDAPAAVVWGTGVGARVALHLACRRPDRVAAVAAFDAALSSPPSRAQRAAASERARAERQAAGIAEAVRARDWFLHRDPRLAREAARAAFADRLTATALASLAAPVLVVAGRHEPNLAGARRLAAALPRARLEVLAGAGHASVIERPRESLRLFLGFLVELTRSSPQHSRGGPDSGPRSR